jgi:hypothetical protein
VADWAADPRCVVHGRSFRARLRAGWEPLDALTTPARQQPPARDDA